MDLVRRASRGRLRWLTSTRKAALPFRARDSKSYSKRCLRLNLRLVVSSLFLGTVLSCTVTALLLIHEIQTL